MLAYMPLIRLRYLSTGVENLVFLRCQPSFGVKGGKPLANNPLDDRFLETVGPTSSPIFGGHTLY
jgi:hypothetical protein